MNERESDGISAISEFLYEKSSKLRNTDCKENGYSQCKQPSNMTRRKEGGDLTGGYARANIEINCEVDDPF